MKRTLSILAVIALGMMTACNKLDNNTEPKASFVYCVSIPATIGGEPGTKAVAFDGNGSDITSWFMTNEVVYVYNVTTSTILDGALHTSNISADGKSCDLTGTLTGTISSGDDLKLFYELNNFSHLSPSDTYFSYSVQTGASTHVRDGAEATVKVNDFTGGVLTTTATASFQNLQSMFRQRLTFKNSSNETVTPTITSLKIRSKNNNLVFHYRPLLSEANLRGPFDIDNPVIDANGDIYLALRFVGSDGTDALTFTAIDSEENVYECTKAAPTGGFQNGKYYHGSMTLPYVRKANQPIFTGTEGYSVTLVDQDMFRINNSGNPVTFGISGTCSGYKIYVNYVAAGNTITISNLNATYGGNDYFLDCNHGLNLVVDGDNSITCPNHTACIGARDSGDILKLSGNGTLTVTAKSASNCGLYANGNYTTSNNLNGTTTQVDVTTLLAATGYTVIRSARTDNADGTYTWTYTVTPTE